RLAAVANRSAQPPSLCSPQGQSLWGCHAHLLAARTLADAAIKTRKSTQESQKAREPQTLAPFAPLASLAFVLFGDSAGRSKTDSLTHLLALRACISPSISTRFATIFS